MRAFGTRWHYLWLGKGPFIVRSNAVPHEKSRFRRIQRDPDVRLYTDLNPHYAEGDSLLVWMLSTQRTSPADS